MAFLNGDTDTWEAKAKRLESRIGFLERQLERKEREISDLHAIILKGLEVHA